MSEVSALRRLEMLSHHFPQGIVSTKDSCGIIAVIGGSLPSSHYVMEGLTILQNRGYDSAGFVTITQDGDFNCSKFASENTTSDALDKLKSAMPSHDSDNKIAIGHTRWATHGAKTDRNAHPHMDAKNRVTVVHNGVIENSEELKEILEREGFHCISETDSEVVAQLLGYLVEKKGMRLFEACEEAQRRMEGSWGIAAMDRKFPEELVAFAHGSPLLIGLGSDCRFIASEAAAFAKYTKQYMSLKDGEVVKVTIDGEVERGRTEIYETDEAQQAASPAPYPHWTLKEINDQPAAIMRALNFGGRFLDDRRTKLGGLEENKNSLKNVDHLVIAACGTSLHAGMWGCQLMRILGCFKTTRAVDAAELESYDLPQSARGGLLVVSQSGETKDVLRALSKGFENDLPCISVVNSVGSTIARKTKCGIYLNAGREVAVASTKAFTCQTTVLALVAIWFAQNKGEHGKSKHLREALVSDLHSLSMNLNTTIKKTHEECKSIANFLFEKNIQKLFILGKGMAHPIALEGALKIKEIAYIQAEGYAGGALKHGPFALIEQGTPVFLIILDDHEKKRMLTAAAEVTARGAYVVVITECNDIQVGKNIKRIVRVSNNGLLTSILASIPFQIIAYELSFLKGINPDKPRNLAKSVTVD